MHRLCFALARAPTSLTIAVTMKRRKKKKSRYRVILCGPTLSPLLTLHGMSRAQSSRSISAELCCRPSWCTQVKVTSLQTRYLLLAVPRRSTTCLGLTMSILTTMLMNRCLTHRLTHLTSGRLLPSKATTSLPMITNTCTVLRRRRTTSWALLASAVCL